MYKTIKCSFNALTEELNKCSQYGWDLVQVFQGKDEHMYVLLKRRCIKKWWKFGH